MLEYLLILRVIHITTGVFWAGAAIMLAYFLLPATAASGPEGSRVMRQLAMTNNFPMVMNVAAVLNILSGLMLYDSMSNHFQAEWIHSTHGMTLTIGGLAALVAFFMGFTINRPAGMRMAEIGKAIAASGGKPNESQAAEMAAIGKKLTKTTKRIAVFLIIAVLTMSMAKYI